MKILNKKVYRELFKFNKGRSFAIVLTLTLTVGFLFGLTNSKAVFYDSYDLNMKELHTPNLRLDYNNFIQDSNVSSLLTNHASELQQAGITENGLEGRINIYTQIEYNGKSYDALWVALNSTEAHPNQIDQLREVEGNNFFTNDSQALLIFQFANGLIAGHGVTLNDQVHLKLNNTVLPALTVTGIVQSNEFTYVINGQTGAPTFGAMAVIYTSLNYAWSVLNQNHVINQILVRTDQQTKEAGTKALATLSPLLSDQHAPIYKSVSFLDTPDRKFFEADAGSIDKFAVVLGGFALAIGVILVYNSLTKLINSQRKYIGLLGAMGSNRRTIMTHYTSLGVILGIIGIIFGILFSLLIMYSLSFVMLGFYGFVYIQLSFDPVLLVGGTLITLIAITAFSIIACLPVLEITPREAMTSTYTRVALNRRPVLERVLKKVPGFKGILASVPLRETFMNKKRSSLTIIAIAVSTIILVVSGAMMVDILLGVQTDYTVYNTYDGKVVMSSFEPWSSVSATLKDKLGNNITAEPYLFLPLDVYSGSNYLSNQPIEVINRSSSMRDFHIIEGGAPVENSNEILVGEVSARDWNVSVGSTLTLKIGELNQSVNVKVSGIVGELIDTDLYTYFDVLDTTLHLPTTYVNGFLFDVTNNNDQTFSSVEDVIYQNFNVIQLENAQSTFETTMGLFEVFVEFLSMFMVIGMAMVVVFTFNTIYVSYSDREMEYLALRAQGMKRRSLLKVLGIETIILGIVGFVISIPLSYVASVWALDYMMGKNYYIQVFIPDWMWIGLFVLTMGSVILASILVARRVNKAKLPDVLRNRQIG